MFRRLFRVIWRTFNTKSMILLSLNEYAGRFIMSVSLGYRILVWRKLTNGDPEGKSRVNKS